MPLVVNGMVHRPYEFESHKKHFRRTRRVLDFTCLEGWTKPAQAWSGYRLDHVVGLADPSANARFVEIASGGFVAVLPLSEMSHALLADRKDGKPLTSGGWRLVIADGLCYNSVKDVDRITLVADDSGATARSIALERLDTPS